MADIVVPGERFAFDEDVWAEEVGRLSATGHPRVSAVSARRQIERPQARIAARACESDGPAATRLVGCAKVYVPLDVEPSLAPYGFVFAIRVAPGSGRVVLRMLAYGERHPGSGARSVYERAHRRLHGRYPDE